MNKIGNKIRKYRPYDTFSAKVDALIDRANGKSVVISKIDKNKFINHSLTQDIIKHINKAIDGEFTYINLNKYVPANAKMIVKKLKELSGGSTPVGPKYEAVDLGLPSGLKWANMNVGATSPEDAGPYFAWGDTEGHEKNDGHNFSYDDYKANGLNVILTDLTLAQDAAHAKLDGSWRMPTHADFQELLDNTNATWTTINGVAGHKFTNKTDTSKYIFIPATGYRDDGLHDDWGICGRIWSSTFYEEDNAYYLHFSSSGQYVDTDCNHYGYCVRGVCE